MIKIRSGRIMIAGANSMPKGSQEPAIQGAADQAQVDHLMRRFLEGSQSGPVASPPAVQPEPSTLATRSPRDFDMSTELLDRAAKAFDLLINRCTALEEDLNRETDRAQGPGSRGRTTRSNSGSGSPPISRRKLESSERAATALKQRCETTEARADTAERRVTALERATADAASHAALAEQLSTRLRDKVIIAFGIGSRAHPVLEAIETQVKAK